MSEPLQSGHVSLGHPDAEQLSAFVEQALPAHEQQQTLAHLAVCGHCRAIVYLAQQTGDEEALAGPIAAPRKRRFADLFSHWQVALPAVAALAGLLLITGYVTHIARSSNGNTPGAIAAAGKPELEREPRPEPKPAAPPVAERPSDMTPKPASALHAEPQARRAPSNEPAVNTAAIEDQSGREEENLPVNGRSVAGLKTESGPPIAKPAEQAGQSASAGAAAGNGTGYAVSARHGLLGGIASMRSRSAAPSLKEQTAQRAQPPASASAPGSAAGTTVSVQAQAAAPALSAELQPTIETSNAALAVDAVSIDTALKLPSHLPAVSHIASDNKLLAIDSAGTLFLSKDAGRHWKSIKPHWPGHAVQLDLVATRASQAAGAATTNASGIVMAAPQGQTANLYGSLSGTVTDPTGAVIPRASVMLTAISTGKAQSTQTDPVGRYVFDRLTPGSYQLQATAAGFDKRLLRGIEISAAQSTEFHLTLQVGAAAQTVSVEASTSELQDERQEQKRRKATSASPVFELTTDTGAIWTSSDGRQWKPRAVPQK